MLCMKTTPPIKNRWSINPRLGLVATFVVACIVFPGVAHAQYTESFQSWSATSAATWQTKDLSGAPFNVPADAVVEIAIRNDNNVFERSGGVRAVGSSLDRRLLLMEAESNGITALVMHVQADASSQIQHYAENTSDVDFVLLGYWTSGTYVDRFDTFTAGASDSWTDKDLCSFNVGPAHVAEIVMTNDDPANPRSAGVRTKGSSLDRRVTVVAAVGGGVIPATMFVKADTSQSAGVQLYAEDDTDVDFYLVGYWSVPPMAYTELITEVGSPNASATWEDKDLTASGVPDSAIAEFVLLNRDTVGPYNMGVRTNGSSLGRLLELHKAAFGGGTPGRMHVLTDSTATIEFYHANISKTHTFNLTGYWTACDASIEYVVSDLGAVTAANKSLGWHINSAEKVAGFEENGSGDPDAWSLSCGAFTALGVLGGSDAEAHGINDDDMVVGWSDDGSGNRRAFRWTSGGGMVNLGTAGGRTDSEALSVNASSEIVGTVLDFDSPQEAERQAFLYLPADAYGLGSGMNLLGTLGGEESVATDINDSGQVVGGAENAGGEWRPFLWANGTFTNLGTLGGETVTLDHRAEAVNVTGEVCGRSYTAAGAKRAFHWDGSMTDLGVLTGGTESWAFGLNDSNVVVGTSDVTGGAFRAFVWDATNGMRNLNNLIPTGTGWTLIRATDINNDGFITGWGTNGSGDTRAFLLTSSCSAGGGGATAAASLAEGLGVVDQAGRYLGTAVGVDGATLAEIVIAEADSGATIEYAVRGPNEDSLPSPGTLDGFAEGVALPRTLEVRGSMAAGAFKTTVSLTASLSELADLGVGSKQVELHVFDPAQGSLPGRWIPAGKNIGESAPTGVLGESGFVAYTDGTLDYWAVRDKFGIFAVGKPTEEPPPPDGSVRPPRLCGIGMLPPWFVVAGMFLVLRRGRGFRRMLA